jgi:hypothetical protein
LLASAALKQRTGAKTFRQPPNQAIGQQFQAFAQVLSGLCWASPTNCQRLLLKAGSIFANDIIRHVIEEG